MGAGRAAIPGPAGHNANRTHGGVVSELDKAMDGRETTETGACASPSGRPETEDERRTRLQKLKEQIRAGTYRPDMADIALQLTSMMNPTL